MEAEAEAVRLIMLCSEKKPKHLVEGIVVKMQSAWIVNSSVRF